MDIWVITITERGAARVEAFRDRRKAADRLHELAANIHTYATEDDGGGYAGDSDTYIQLRLVVVEE